MRQRYSYARFDGGQLVFRYLTVTVRIDLVEIRRSRIVKLAAAVQGRVRTPKSLAVRTPSSSSSATLTPPASAACSPAVASSKRSW